MAKRIVRHGLTNAEARRRIEPQIEAYASQYGLSSIWEGEGRWVGSRTGVRIGLRMLDSAVEVDLKKSLLIPYSETRILGEIERTLAGLLSG